MRLGGWQRIGIVISIVWAIGAAMYQRNADVKRASTAASLAYKICTDNESYRKDERNCSRELKKSWAVSLEGSWGNVAIVSLVPVPLGWITAYGLIGMSRWVRRGFNRKKAQE